MSGFGFGCLGFGAIFWFGVAFDFPVALGFEARVDFGIGVAFGFLLALTHLPNSGSHQAFYTPQQPHLPGPVKVMPLAPQHQILEQIFSTPTKRLQGIELNSKL